MQQSRKIRSKISLGENVQKKVQNPNKKQSASFLVTATLSFQQQSTGYWIHVTEHDVEENESAISRFLPSKNTAYCRQHGLMHGMLGDTITYLPK